MTLAVQPVSVKPLIEEAWELRENVTIADAVYVTLARHLGAALVTLDERLARTPDLAVEVVTLPPSERP